MAGPGGSWNLLGGSWNLLGALGTPGRRLGSPREAPGSSKRRPEGQMAPKRLPKELPKSVDPRSDVLQTHFRGGRFTSPPTPPPLDPLAGRTPKNDQGSDPNSKKNMTARFTRVLSAFPGPLAPIWEHFESGSGPQSRNRGKSIRVSTLLQEWCKIDQGRDPDQKSSRND